MTEPVEPRSPTDSGLVARSVVFVACVTYLLTALFLAVIAVSVWATRGYEPVAVSSDSMAPLIRRGDILFVQPMDADLIGTGDVVTFPRPGADGLVSHRVVSIDERGLVTRGDANGIEDSTPLDPTSVAGVGRVLVPFSGFPLLWLSQGDWARLAAWIGSLVASSSAVHRLASGPTAITRTVTRRRAERRDPHGPAARRILAPRLPAIGATGVALTFALMAQSASGSFTAAAQNTASNFSADLWHGIGSVATGAEHSCAADLEGSVWCWGRNDQGQLGDDSTTDSEIPVQVVGSGGAGTLTDIDVVAAGENHACGLRSDDTVWCWGDNANGQLGDNSTSDRQTPVQVVGPGGPSILSSVVSIAAGADHTCAARSDGTAYCWGHNGNGQLGDDTTIGRDTPTQVAGVGGGGTLANVASLGAGAATSCAVTTSGAAYCWGDNDEGQLGDDTTTESETPVQVVGVGGTGTLASVGAIDGGEKHTCAARSDGGVHCWGRNDEGQLGDDTTTDSSSPVAVKGEGGVGTLGTVVGLGAGYRSSCAATSGGAAYCWGENGDGQLGDDSTTPSDTPVRVVGSGGVGNLTGVLLVAVGGNGGTGVGGHACAARPDEEVWCWGRNGEGQLGNNSTTGYDTPVEAQL